MLDVKSCRLFSVTNIILKAKQIDGPGNFIADRAALRLTVMPNERASDRAA